MALKVYRASAGTGKTYRLTLMYLTLLLGNVSRFDPRAFYRILAVTFTNKATDQMKTRILDTLESLAAGKTPAMGSDLCRETGLPFEQIVSRAATVHKTLLHNYSWFSVSTLDAFFQRVLQSFVMEAGLGSGYSVDTDTDYLLDKTARRMISRIPQDDSLREWFMHLINEKIARSDSWDAFRLLKEVGYQATRESFRTMGESFAGKISDRDFLRDYMGKYQQIIRDFEHTMASRGKMALELISSGGFSAADFPNKDKSFARYFEKISDPYPSVDSYIPGKRVLDALDGTQAVWYNKSSPAGLENMQQALMPVLRSIYDHYQSHYHLYATAVAIREQLPQMGLLADVITTMRQVQEEDNTLDIGDSTYLLSQLAGEGNTPFIYERIGGGYESFLLDEFQDTSYLQWKNMHPLLVNGLSQGADSLIVGDVKQAIYRWRNSDWKILGEEIAKDPQLIGQGVDFFSLNTNRRSYREIVGFINMLIDRVLMTMSEAIREKTKSCDNLEEGDRNYFESLLFNAYLDHTLNTPRETKEDPPGYVRVNTFASHQEDSAIKKALSALQDLLVSLLARGYDPSDILILVRSREHARTITRHFLQSPVSQYGEGFQWPRVVSEDSLYLASSPAINLVISLFRMVHYRHEPSHARAAQSLLSDFGKPEIMDDCEFLDRLRFLPLADAFEAIVQKMDWTGDLEALPYLQELHDMLLLFAGKDRGGVYAFLNWWKDRGKEKMLSTGIPGQTVRVLTIHKAKGLEARVVIVPFCNWPLDTRTGSQVIWAGTRNEPFNQPEQLPVLYNDRLLHTFFVRDYFLEFTQRYLDSLNLLYVSITRAREELYIFLPQTNTSSREDISFHIKKALFQNQTEGDMVWSCGLQLSPVRQNRNEQEEGYRPRAYPSYDFRDSLSLVYREDDFEYDAQDSIRQWGVVLHKALSRLETEADIARVLEELVMEGELSGNKETVSQYAAIIEKTLSDPQVACWFDGSWTVRNESSILGPTGKLRPDRVMEKDGKTVILDYKFGKPDPLHHKQMSRYVAALGRMGYKQVEGRLLYFNP
ncbi:MAG TPA: UvrD-helicase domain-containing protein [Bacteroidales bacterium]|nr:UvrD-helicase domain-containing protein [Bacteroidales bacterium]HQP64231.1 UvrD-helicase domain-containing protein [Bacteroidales bacterium]